jgi:predicted P-loop ATPase
MSITTDEIRKAYDRNLVKLPRRFILAATTNEDQWLRDETGNRRFWPVRCKNIDLEALKNDREQLWAEAVHLYKNGEKWWIDREDDAWEAAEQEQAERMIDDDVWHEAVTTFVGMQKEVKINDILSELKIDLADRNRANQMRVSIILRRLGYKCALRRSGTKVLRVYAKDDAPEPEQQEILL